VATGGKRDCSETPNQAESVATGCDPLPLDLDGKEGIDYAMPDQRAAGAQTGARRLKGLQIS
jgi:hypothetical protein